MTYQQTVEWMFQQLPMYQRVGSSAFKKDLSNTLKLAAHLGFPERDFKSVHVAGTNGKGSSSHMIASVLQEAGYNVGLYTSPHLKDYRERIRINGSYISEEAVIDFIQNNKTFFEAENLSFFEMSVGMAFWYFAKEKVDIAVVEVGMGGRLDSTNIIIPEVSLITNIGKDHTQFLGTTLPEIAGEKAGIIKENVPVIISEKHPETQEVFIKTAEERNAAIVFAEELKAPVHLSTDLLGSYQEKNIKGVRAVIRQLISQGWKISEEHLREGLKNVRKNTNLRGRWDILQEFPKVICDTAHNSDGLKYVFNQLEDETFEHLHFVFGVVNDKDLDEVLPIFPKRATYYFCKPDVPRGLEAEKLMVKSIEFGLLGKVFNSVGEAYAAAIKAAGTKDLIFCGGSNFTVAEII
ncbi:bifunctional folylpolyglutamate synthase/dihydrofolate synthase [Zunongwangia profunda]|nr:folylpolyglutamate synthase/dihydrofolate synthase family protein [Zunongwangia profunda]HAJ80849.1 bifunctional folylpolyglutamate synthase/dihydrofolate synthase [Zunongwangia profunda]HCV79721.1 bifunctional folylpolyglutamate synthase/dihydrofolate synthase [Zunongwangia profunda]|tara:strand:+ start:701 stop:1921 length:1221 start_codon:yes stop_codon:yes gene_type:complete